MIFRKDKIMNDGAFFTNQYTNLFAQIGISQEKIDMRINETFETMFFDPEERIYFEKGNDMGYMLDTGNMDARTEGMSYGMMMAVQMDRKDIFDRLWLFSKTYMYQSKGKYQGYFAWSVSPEGVKNAEGPAPDGEEYYAMALFFAGKRWGDGAEPFNYSVQARDILRHCIHQSEIVKKGSPMWDSTNHYIKFVPETPFSDPSYHLPHFYELFALLADEQDREFWKIAAEESRKYLHKVCDPITGLSPELSEFDGSPSRHPDRSHYFSDAYRVVMNIGLDVSWFNRDEKLVAIADKLQAFFSEKTRLGEYTTYTLKGESINGPVLHPYAIIATNAAGSLAAKGKYRMDWVKNLWELPLRKGDRRYYDNCLYFFCMLMLAGQYKIYI